MKRRRHLEQLLSVGFLFSFARCVLEGPIVIDEEASNSSGACVLIVIVGVNFPVILDQWQVPELILLEGVGATIPVTELIAAVLNRVFVEADMQEGLNFQGLRVEAAKAHASGGRLADVDVAFPGSVPWKILRLSSPR